MREGDDGAATEPMHGGGGSGALSRPDSITAGTCQPRHGWSTTDRPAGGTACSGDTCGTAMIAAGMSAGRRVQHADQGLAAAAGAG
jgi:hypothetical protein